MRPATLAWVRAGLVALAVVVLDQLAKALVRSSVGAGEEHVLFPGVHIVHVHNEGVAFSALKGAGTLVAIIIAAAVIALLVYFATHATKPLVWLPTGMLVGGALGNIVDRVRQGYVTDFIKLPAWPAFNVADMAITFGVVLLLFVVERANGRDGYPDGAAGEA